MKKPIFLAILGLLALLAAGVLAGCSGSNHGSSTQATGLAPGEVAIQVTDAGFVPDVVTVPKGQPATLVVTRRTEATCATAMVFTASGEKHDLPLNQTVRIALPADHADTIDFGCPMNMIKGKIVSD